VSRPSRASHRQMFVQRGERETHDSALAYVQEPQFTPSVGAQGQRREVSTPLRYARAERRDSYRSGTKK